MRSFDVIVVGGGPAGASAARMLGEAGIQTLLLDKSAFPRDKPCGGGISARVMPRFPYLKAAGKKFEYTIYENAPGGHDLKRTDTKMAK